MFFRNKKRQEVIIRSLAAGYLDPDDRVLSDEIIRQAIIHAGNKMDEFEWTNRNKYDHYKACRERLMTVLTNRRMKEWKS